MKEVNSIFEEPWWLDAVSQGKWECIEVKNKNGELVGRWPICYRKILGFKAIRNPQYTQTLGPWIKSDASKYTKYLSTKKKIIEELIAQLPYKPYNFFVTLDSSNEYILPFRWRGFQYTPSFSYRFSDLTDLDEIYKNIDSKQKTVIKKASQLLSVHDDCPLEVLFRMMQLTNERQKRKKGLNEKLILRIDNACKEHGACKLLVAKDAKGNNHAAVYLVYDEKVCYYLFGGADPQFRNSGAQSLLIWEAIKFASTVSSVFDFEGSNVEAIERFFRSFGSQFVVNYTIKRLNLFLSVADMFSLVVKKFIFRQHI